MTFVNVAVRIGIACTVLLSGSNMLAATAAQESVQPHTVVLLDFSSTVPEHFWQALKAELDNPQIVHKLGSRIMWMNQEQFRKGINFPELFHVSLRGDCISMGQSDDAAPGPLGWVYRVGAEIQPFAFVNCNRIRYVLGPAMRGQPREKQQYEMARAIARIVTHELIHIRTQSSRHTKWGLQKAYLTEAELLRDDIF